MIMRSLSASELLDVWERGSAQPFIERAITLLAASCPGLDRDGLARLTLGQRDRLLLSLRESMFGPRVAALASCSECNEKVEFDFEIDDIRVQDFVPEAEEIASLAIDDCSLRFRLPNSLDLAATAQHGDASMVRQRLIERCLVSASTSAGQLSAAGLPERVLDELEVQMSKLDPQANVQLALQCPACNKSWRATFDIFAFLWSELAACAERLVVEVHALASAYGWSEADILAMTATRRGVYLSLAG